MTAFADKVRGYNDPFPRMHGLLVPPEPKALHDPQFVPSGIDEMCRRVSTVLDEGDHGIGVHLHAVREAGVLHMTVDFGVEISSIGRRALAEIAHQLGYSVRETMISRSYEQFPILLTRQETPSAA